MMIEISIHALLAESDSACFGRLEVVDYFYPRSPCGERRHQQGCHQDCQQFLSTLSLRRATWKKSPPMCSTLHFYPRSPCGERQLRKCCFRTSPNFYPRSPCGERRLALIFTTIAEDYFYPRSPCGERLTLNCMIGPPCVFLSTLSLRRATPMI